MKNMRESMSSAFKNLSELHENQVVLDKDIATLKDSMKCHDEISAELQSQISVNITHMSRQKQEIDEQTTKLMERIDKAEHDRMDKYYK